MVADDLIWQERLARFVAAAGGVVERAKTGRDIEARLRCSDAAIVDLTARAYDPVAAVETAARGGRPVIAVAQHDELALRKRALAAGAARVYSYAKLHSDGAAVVGAWIEAMPAGAER